MSEVWRLLNPDGTFNVTRRRVRGFKSPDLYHRLLRISWRRFLALVISFYVGVNLLFALAYLLCGPGAMGGIPPALENHPFLVSFFFSIQTFTTIGYGGLHPMTILSNIVVVFEAFTGLLALAVLTGLVFSRFARPTARVLFSNRAILGPHEGVPSLIFRMANERVNQIVDATVTVVLARDEVTVEGDKYRNFYELELETRRSPIFALSWTVVHPIDERSPLRGLDDQGLRGARAEFIVSLTGIDDTFAQTILAKYSYTPDEIVWGGHFADILTRRGPLVEIDLTKIHDLETRR